MAETISHGLRTIAAWQREPLVATPTWPAAAPVVVTRRIPVLSVQPVEGAQVVTAGSTRQGYGRESADVRAIQPAETWPCQLRYQGFEQLLACAMGYMAKRLSGVLQPAALGSGVYRHLLEMDQGLSTVIPWTTADGFTGGELASPLYRVRRGTAAVDRQVSVWEHRSTMVSSLTIAATLERVTVTVGLVGYRRVRDSVVNTSAVLQQTTLMSSPNVLFRHGVLRLGAYSTSTPLGPGDILRPSTWQLTIDNHLGAGPGPRTGLYSEEYEKPGVSTLTLSLGLARYRNDTQFTRLLAGTLLMGDVKLTGPLIGSTGVHYQHNLYFPQCVLTDVASPVQGATVPGITHQATLLTPETQPASFPVPNHLGPLQIELINQESQHPLLD